MNIDLRKAEEEEKWTERTNKSSRTITTTKGNQRTRVEVTIEIQRLQRLGNILTHELNTTVAAIG